MASNERTVGPVIAMDPAHLRELAALETSYWWHVAKRELIVELLTRHAPPPARLVEGGTGTGGNLATFRELGYEALGFDESTEAVLQCHQRGLHDVVQHDVNKSWPFDQGSRDIVVLLDVLEHCPDAMLVWQNAKKVLRPGGLVILNVPSIPWLFGPWDQALGHYCRYTARRLRREAQEAGLLEVWVSSWNAFSLMPAIAVRTMQKLRGSMKSATFPRVPPWLNRLLIGAARIERRALRHCSLPFGLSVAGVFRR